MSGILISARTLLLHDLERVCTVTGLNYVVLHQRTGDEISDLVLIVDD